MAMMIVFKALGFLVSSATTCFPILLPDWFEHRSDYQRGRYRTSAYSSTACDPGRPRRFCHDEREEEGDTFPPTKTSVSEFAGDSALLARHEDSVAFHRLKTGSALSRALGWCLLLLFPLVARAGHVAGYDENLIAGLSPYNWVIGDGAISTSTCGASLQAAFRNTKQVNLEVDTSCLSGMEPSCYPIIAWTVNGGKLQSHQLRPGEKSLSLVVNVLNPAIDLYVKGMSPFEDRFNGSVPPNSLVVTGFTIDDGAATVPVKLPAKIWLNIGDSIMSGDASALAPKQGRPSNAEWAASDDARNSYGYLLANHFSYRESRLAYGGYNWRGGLAKIPPLTTLIAQITSTMPRSFEPVEPDMVLINLGENGVPAAQAVIDALGAVRSRVGGSAKIVVMIPVSGKGRDEITKAFKEYAASSKDASIFLVDLKKIALDTADGQHPTASGHRAIFREAVSKMASILRK